MQQLELQRKEANPEEIILKLKAVIQILQERNNGNE